MLTETLAKLSLKIRQTSVSHGVINRDIDEMNMTNTQKLKTKTVQKHSLDTPSEAS